MEGATRNPIEDGSASLSAMAILVAPIAYPAKVPLTLKDSEPSAMSSSITLRLNVAVPLRCPPEMVTRRSDTVR